MLSFPLTSPASIDLNELEVTLGGVSMQTFGIILSRRF